MNQFEQLKNTHLALTQYYRWYQMYELPVESRSYHLQKNAQCGWT